MKLKIQQKLWVANEHKINSPWNVATDFLVNMSLSVGGIADILNINESDHHTNMDASEIAQLLYDYRSSYSFLVTKLCKLMDE